MGDYLWMIRSDSQDEDIEYSIVYGGEHRLFSLKVHHGGEFILKPKIRCVKGSVNFVNCCDIYYFDRDILQEMVKTIGYPPDMVFYFHFKIPDKSFETGLRVIDNQHACNLMFNYVTTGHKLLEVYVEHWESRIPDYRVVGQANYATRLERQKRISIDDTEQFDDECEDGRDNLLPSMCPTTLIPPKHHKPIGRSTKTRRKSADEVQKSFDVGGKLTRKGVTTTCGKCGKQGHNSRCCRGQGVESAGGKKVGKEKTSSGKRKVREKATIQDLSQNAPSGSQDPL